jgi:hypothetical protein
MVQLARAQRRNLIPLALIAGLSLMAVSLLTRRPDPPSPEPIVAYVAVASSYSGTSLFGNDHYLGEIGPQGREFVVPPGHLRLRVIHSYCHAADTAFDVQAGARHPVGNLDPACDRQLSP